MAFVAGAGDSLGLAQWRRSAQGHGGPHVVVEAGATGIAAIARAAAGADQPDALPSPAGNGVSRAQ
ncbi:MAG: hypothetical protein MZV70_77615 [Desulfobacterales bacterium]|nr:hypothetical protein [Desulfobacterales bacterium]